MKKVYFDRQDSLGNKILVFIMVLFLIIYVITMLGSLSEKINGISGVIGFGASVIFFGKQFIFRYYLGWNKKGFVIKINSFLSYSYAYRDIKSFSFKENRLEILDQHDSSKIYDLNKIIPEDIERIKVILNSAIPGKAK